MPRKLTNWLQNYLDYTRHLEAPDTFHFWAGISTIAGALRGKVWIDMGYWKWKPNFFIVYVAPPGVATKSTTIGVGMSLLREVEGIHFGPDSVTWQALTDSFADSTESFQLANKEIIESSSITVAVSEFGTFFDPRNRDMVDLLVDLWDGRDVPWKRRTRYEGESLIPNPWFNLVAACTPSWIAENFSEYTIGGGMSSRTIYLWADKKRKLVAYPGQEVTDQDEDTRAALIHDLNQIARIAGPYSLTQDALEWGTAWYTTHWLDLPDHLQGERMGGYVSRKQTHIHKMAMILAAAQRDELIINVNDLVTAEKIITIVEKEIPKVFANISSGGDSRNLGALLEYIRFHRKVAKQALWREMMMKMDIIAFESAVRGGIESGLITQHVNGHDSYLIATELLEKPAALAGIPDEIFVQEEDSSPPADDETPSAEAIEPDRPPES